MPNVLSPRDLVSRPDKIDETVLHTYILKYLAYKVSFRFFQRDITPQKEIHVTRTSSVFMRNLP